MVLDRVAVAVVLCRTVHWRSQFSLVTSTYWHEFLELEVTRESRGHPHGHRENMHRNSAQKLTQAQDWTWDPTAERRQCYPLCHHYYYYTSNLDLMSYLLTHSFYPQCLEIFYKWIIYFWKNISMKILRGVRKILKACWKLLQTEKATPELLSIF